MHLRDGLWASFCSHDWLFSTACDQLGVSLNHHQYTCEYISTIGCEEHSSTLLNLFLWGLRRLSMLRGRLTSIQACFTFVWSSNQLSWRHLFLVFTDAFTSVFCQLKLHLWRTFRCVPVLSELLGVVDLPSELLGVVDLTFAICLDAICLELWGKQLWSVSKWEDAWSKLT